MSDIHESVLRRLTHEILFTKKTEDEIINGIAEDTYLNKYEISLMYIETLQNIVDVVKKVGNKKEKAKELVKKKYRK